MLSIRAAWAVVTVFGIFVSQQKYTALIAITTGMDRLGNFATGKGSYNLCHPGGDVL
jgi:hypothetical protein